MSRRPPRSTRTDTLFPYTTLFRSDFCMSVLGIAKAQLDDVTFDMLSALGFSKAQVEAANTYCCGAMTLEGAPHLKSEHLPIFDCANPCGRIGKQIGRASGRDRVCQYV